MGIYIRKLSIKKKGFEFQNYAEKMLQLFLVNFASKKSITITLE